MSPEGRPVRCGGWAMNEILGAPFGWQRAPCVRCGSAMSLFGLLGPRQRPQISQWRSDRPRKRLTDTVPRVRLLVRPYGKR